MKKIILFFLCSLFILQSSFADDRPFNKRVFDFTVETPLNVSNNLIGIEDIFQEKIVIDFTKIADNMSDDGFSVIANANPKISLGLDIPNGLVFKLNTGVDVFSTVGIGKDLFDFLGHGNTINEDININVNGNADVFFYLGLDVGWNTKKFSLVVSPSLYATLFHASLDKSSVVISNSVTGDFSYTMNANLSMYSDYLTFFRPDFDVMELLEIDYLGILDNAGLDVTVSASYDLYRYLTIYGSTRIPVIPSKITKKMEMTASSTMTTSLVEISGGTMPSPTFDFQKGNIEDAEISINRPLKINLYGKFHPFDGVMDYYGGIGIGIEHPFAGDGLEADFYFDYMLGLRVGFWNVLNIYLTTQRLDLIYSHKLELNMNFRILELSIGVSADSSSFLQSFRGAGLGAYIKVATGF